MIRLRVELSGLEIRLGEQVPSWYGLAYRAHNADVWVCYPMPLNWIVGWWQLLRASISRGPVAHFFDDHGWPKR